MDVRNVALDFTLSVSPWLTLNELSATQHQARQQQQHAWTNLAQAMHKQTHRPSPADAGKVLGDVLAKASAAGADPTSCALEVCLAALHLATAVLGGSGGADAAKAVKTALDKGMTWQINGILGKMRAQDGSPLYLVDWEPTWEPPAHLDRTQIVRFEGRSFLRSVTELEAEEAPRRKPKTTKINKPASEKKTHGRGQTQKRKRAK